MEREKGSLGLAVVVDEGRWSTDGGQMKHRWWSDELDSKRLDEEDKCGGVLTVFMWVF